MIRFRKRIKLAPGVHINVRKRGASVSVGGHGATVNIGSKGARTTVGIPGSGISYTTWSHSHHSGETVPTVRQAPGPVASTVRKFFRWFAYSVIGIFLLAFLAKFVRSLFA